MESEKTESLKKQVSAAKQELEDGKKNATPQVVKEVNNFEIIMDKFFEKAMIAFNTWSDNQKETRKYSIDKRSELELKRLEVIEKADKRNKLYRVIVLSIGLCATMYFAHIDKLEGVAGALIATGLTLALNAKDDIKERSEKLMSQVEKE